MGQLSVTLFGGFQARVDSGCVLRLRSRQTQALLAYLALPCGRRHSRDELATLLWGHLAQDGARSRLRQTLFTLRRALGATHLSALSQDGDTVCLVASGVEVDALVFEALVRDGSPEALGRAAALYRGDLLQGLPAQGPRSSAFEEWLGGERERLRELALEALARLVSAQRAGGSPEHALAATVRLLALDPLQESAHRTAMRLHVQLGRRAAALRQYQVCVSLLRRELNVEPEEETRDLYRDILRRRAIVGVAERRPSGGELRAAASPSDDESPLIGREAEIDRLRAWITTALNGTRQVGFLVGETGAGKSRLVGRLATEARAADGERVRIMSGRCHEGEQALAFGPWSDLLRAARLSDERGVLEGLEPVWRAEVTRLLPELSAPDASPSSEPPDAARLFEAVRRLLVCLAGRAPILVVLEDLHWADEASLRLLQFIARRTRSAPLLLVGTMREEELPDLPLLRATLESLELEPHVERLRVPPLSRRSTVKLVRALSSTTTDPAALERISQDVWRASEGNPFVIVETMRALQQGVALERQGGLALVDRVRRVIGRRLEGLGQVARDLACVAAVIGRVFEFRLLQHGAQLDETTAAGGVEELVRRQVLHEAAGGLDFVHERVRGVAYTELLGPRRRLLHRQVAEAIESVHADDLDPHLLALGVHYREGEVWDRAVAYLRRAGLTSAARSAHREAVAALEGALAALEHLPDRPGSLRDAVDIRLDLRNSLWPLGEFQKMVDHLREAERVARTLDDPRPLGWIDAYLSAHAWLMGRSGDARSLATRAHATARTLGDRGLRVVASTYLGLAWVTSGGYREAEEPLRDVVETLAGDLERERCHLPFAPAAYCHALLAWVLAERGLFDESLAHARDAARIVEGVDHPFTEVAVALARASARGVRGDFGDAIPLLERGLALCREFEFRGPITALCAGFLGHAYAGSGRVADSRALLEEALRIITPTAAGAWHGLIVVTVAEAYAMSERFDDAGALATQALALTREHGQRGPEARALRLLGEIALRVEPPDSAAAHAHFTAALRLAESLGMRPLAAHCHAGLARVSRRAGKLAEAQEHLMLATNSYREMGMQFGPEKITGHSSDIRQQPSLGAVPDSGRPSAWMRRTPAQ